MIRVAVVDDHPIVRDGIVANLEESGGIQVVATASGVAEARGALAGADVAIVDLELADGNGLALVRELAASGVRVVVFSAYAGEERVAEALAGGALGYVLKGTPSEELVRAVRTVFAGKSHLSGSVAEQAVSALRAPRRLRITEREREILRLLADGLSNRAIAERLQISERTVKFHVSEILGRLGAENRAQAVALAQQRGLM
ncbi:MAG TPA: response regulator transcription factor [Candidatus Baltobacteraceae bacterium]|nr:response regulator transcription factor [Candidatus Baltobacteraceae bacterium]